MASSGRYFHEKGQRAEAIIHNLATADNNNLIWIDPAGYAVAQSQRPVGWPEEPSSFDFELVVADSTIVGEAYLRHV